MTNHSLSRKQEIARALGEQAFNLLKVTNPNHIANEDHQSAIVNHLLGRGGGIQFLHDLFPPQISIAFPAPIFGLSLIEKGQEYIPKKTIQVNFECVVHSFVFPDNLTDLEELGRGIELISAAFAQEINTLKKLTGIWLYPYEHEHSVYIGYIQK